MSVGTGRQNIIILFWKEQFHFRKNINGNQTFILDSHQPFICSELQKSSVKVQRHTKASEFIDWRMIQSVMLVFSTQHCELLPLYPSLWFNFADNVWLGGGGGVNKVGKKKCQGFLKKLKS
jgi:hypothetical protein